MTWKGPSAYRRMEKSQLEDGPGTRQSKCKGPKGERVWNVLERGRRRVGWGRTSHKDGRRHALGR